MISVLPHESATAFRHDARGERMVAMLSRHRLRLPPAPAREDFGAGTAPLGSLIRSCAGECGLVRPAYF